MRPARKKLIVLLVTILTAFLAWTILREQPASSQPPGTPTALAPNAPTFAPDAALVLNIPQKALWKNYVAVSAEASPGTTCELMYVPPSGKTHQINTTADSSGLCVWKWKVDETEGKGNARLIFTIDGISETHFIEIRSAF